MTNTLYTKMCELFMKVGQWGERIREKIRLLVDLYGYRPVLTVVCAASPVRETIMKPGVSYAGAGGQVHPGDDVSDMESGAERARQASAKALEKFGGEEVAEYVAAGDSFVFRALLWIVPCLYILWYAVAAILMLGFGSWGSFSGIEPFDHVAFSPVATANDWRPLVNWLSMTLTLTLAGPWLIYFFTRAPSRATDCSTAVASIHFFLCTTVTQETPENWIWWATTMPSTVFMGRMAEFMLTRFARKGRRRHTSEMYIGDERSL